MSDDEVYKAEEEVTRVKAESSSEEESYIECLNKITDLVKHSQEPIDEELSEPLEYMIHLAESDSSKIMESDTAVFDALFEATYRVGSQKQLLRFFVAYFQACSKDKVNTIFSYTFFTYILAQLNESISFSEVIYAIKLITIGIQRSKEISKEIINNLSGALDRIIFYIKIIWEIEIQKIAKMKSIIGESESNNEETKSFIAKQLKTIDKMHHLQYTSIMCLISITNNDYFYEYLITNDEFCWIFTNPILVQIVLQYSPIECVGEVLDFLTNIYSIPHFVKAFLEEEEIVIIIPIISQFLMNDSNRLNALLLLQSIADVKPNLLVSYEIAEKDPIKCTFNVNTPFLQTSKYPTFVRKSYEQINPQYFVHNEKNIRIINSFYNIDLDPSNWSPDEIKIAARILTKLMEDEWLPLYIVLTDLFQWFCDSCVDVPYKAKIAVSNLLAYTVEYFKTESFNLFSNIEHIILSISNGIKKRKTSDHTLKVKISALAFLKKHFEFHPDVDQKIFKFFWKYFFSIDPNMIHQKKQKDNHQPDEINEISDDPNMIDEFYAFADLYPLAAQFLPFEDR